MDSKKILNLVTIVMFVITVVLLGLFMFGGEVPNQPYTTPVYTSTLLNWAYILCGIAIIAAIIFPVIRLFTRPKQAMSQCAKSRQLVRWISRSSRSHPDRVCTG